MAVYIRGMRGEWIKNLSILFDENFVVEFKNKNELSGNKVIIFREDNMKKFADQLEFFDFVLKNNGGNFVAVNEFGEKVIFSLKKE